MDLEKFNEELKEFCQEYKESRCSERRIYYIYKKLIPYFGLWRINDPTRVLEREDLESYAFEGFMKALEHFDENKSHFPLNWFMFVVKQTVIRRLKEITKYDKITIFNSTNTEHIDEILEEFNNYEEDEEIINSFQKIHDYKEEIYNLLAKMEEDQNPKLSLAVQWKLAFPYGNRNGLFPFLSYKRRNPISKLKGKIQKYSIRLAEQLFD